MKATLVNRRKFVVFNRTGRPVVIEMELFTIKGKESAYYPEGYRIGWIAFDPESPEKRVLFDSHPPKGIHFHIDGDDEGVALVWRSLAETEQMFFDRVCHHFNIDEKELS
jgi:hypothetical protein